MTPARTNRHCAVLRRLLGYICFKRRYESTFVALLTCEQIYFILLVA